MRIWEEKIILPQNFDENVWFPQGLSEGKKMEIRCCFYWSHNNGQWENWMATRKFVGNTLHNMIIVEKQKEEKRIGLDGKECGDWQKCLAG